jgi:hypothetical protein
MLSDNKEIEGRGGGAEVRVEAEELDGCIQGKRLSTAVPLPQSEPRIVGVHLIVLAIGSRAISRCHGSVVREQIKSLQSFDIGNDLLYIHGD